MQVPYQTYDLSSYFLKVSFDASKFLILKKSNLTFFSFLACAFVLYLRSHFQIQGHAVLHIITSKSFIFLVLTLKSLIHFECMFVYMAWGRRNPTSFFCIWLFSFPAPFFEETVLPPLKDIGSLVEDTSTINMRVHFWTLSSIPLICMSLCWFHTVLITIALG